MVKDRSEKLKTRIRRIKYSLEDNKKFIVQFFIISLLYTTLFMFYFIADAIWPFYQVTRFQLHFTINNVIFDFPSTTSSLLTTAITSLILGIIFQNIITKKYFDNKYKDKLRLEKESRSKKIKQIIFVSIVCMVSEFLKTLVRELNNSFKKEFANGAMISYISLFLIMSFSCTFFNRIISSFRKDISLELDPTFHQTKEAQVKTRFWHYLTKSHFYLSLKKSFIKTFDNPKKIVAILICCLIGFSFTYLIQMWKQAKTWKLLLCEIDGNKIYLFDNKDNMLFTMFFEMLMITIAFKIAGYLDKQKKIRKENNLENNGNIIKNGYRDIIDATQHTVENKKGMIKTILQSLVVTLATNVFTSMRRSITSFKNQESVSSWLICSLLVLVAYVVSTYFGIQNLSDIGNTEKNNYNNKIELNDDYRILCQSEKTKWPLRFSN